MLSGYVAAGCFLVFTGIGTLLQVLKLAARTREQRSQGLEPAGIAEGLQPAREMWGYSAVLLFALSALTRGYIDYFILFSRLPVVVLWTVILWYLHLAQPGARKYFVGAIVGNGLLSLLMALVWLGYRFEQTELRTIVDGSLSIVGLFVFWAKSKQAYLMCRDRLSAGVSIGREAGIALKDFTGLLYSTQIGSELLWVTVTHILSMISSTAILIAKQFVERRVPDTSPGAYQQKH